MNSTKIPITIICGFLGSGKTTLINQILATYPKERFAIVTNEFGDSNIESKFYKYNKDQIIEFPSGCLCHAPKGNIKNALKKLLDFQPNTSHILIEPSGLSDPYAVAAALENVDAIICTLDCANYPNPNFKKEQQRQLDCADIIIATKTDLAPIPNIKTKAKIIPKTTKNLKLILNTNYNHPNSLQKYDEISSHSPHQSLVYKSTQIFDQLKLETFLQKTSNSIVRIKGLVNLDNNQQSSFLLNSVGQRHTLIPTAFCPNTTILFIGSSLDTNQIQSELKKCIHKNDLSIQKKLLNKLIKKINW